MTHDELIHSALRTQAARDWWAGASGQTRGEIVDVLIDRGLEAAVEEVEGLALTDDDKRRLAHDATSGDLCGCAKCEHALTARLAVSRAQSAIQQAAWHPRSKKLRAAADAAIVERERTLRDTPNGCLHDYNTGRYLRPATAAEQRESRDEVASGHAEGVIRVDGRDCYVED